MTIYLDTSTVLRALFRDGEPMPEWGTWDRAYSSELMGIEARRALDRLRLERVLDDDGLADAHDALAATERGIGVIRPHDPTKRACVNIWLTAGRSASRAARRRGMPSEHA